MTFRSYHGKFSPGPDMICEVGAFSGSICSFKTLRSVGESPSRHIDKQLYAGGQKEEGPDVQ